MARMLPPSLPATVPSSAERRIYEMLHTQLGDEWAVLHSLGLTGHPKKPWAEIDFVLVGPSGIFCLEVKGGRVARHEGLWHFTDRYGHTHSEAEGPFAQVSSASASLRAWLTTKLAWVRRVAVGHGVVMPDITFDIDGPDIEPVLVYDRRDLGQPFSAYMRRLADYWHWRLEPVHQGRLELLSDDDRSAVVRELRGDFDLRPSLRTQIDHTRAELLRLTVQQYAVLDGLVDNARAIIRGGAGTGKTLLALEEARRRAADGETVLLCCYNRQLALQLQEAVRDCDAIDVWSLHSFMAAVVAEAGLAGRIPAVEEADLFAVIYPKLCLEGLLLLDRLGRYDALIVDEAQDLLLETYVDVFDGLLRNGIGGGNWRMFLDHRQNLFRATAPAGLARLMETHPAQYRLTVNCRNTAPIATATALLSGVDSDTVLSVEGPKVEYHWYEGPGHERRQISRCIERLLSDGLRPSGMVVLSPRRRENSCLRDGLVGPPVPLVQFDGPAIASPTSAVRFSTIASFKGLESDAVLLVDIDDLQSEHMHYSVYVGASRARVLLLLFLHKGQKHAYSQRAVEFGRRLAAKAEQ